MTQNAVTMCVLEPKMCLGLGLQPGFRWLDSSAPQELDLVEGTNKKWEGNGVQIGGRLLAGAEGLGTSLTDRKLHIGARRGLLLSSASRHYTSSAQPFHPHFPKLLQRLKTLYSPSAQW